MALPSHDLDPEMDQRLLAFAERSWNAQRSVYCLQEIVRLTPRYLDGVKEMNEPGLIDEVRMVWGLAADLASSITGLPPTLLTLVELGFQRADEVQDVIAVREDLALAISPLLKRVDFSVVAPEMLPEVLRTAVVHDEMAKPVLESLQNAIRLFDQQTADVNADGSPLASFSDLVRALDNAPFDFPDWDGRPLFLAEQKAFLFYLAMNSAAEIIADLLTDESLGEFLLRRSGIIIDTADNEAILELNLVPLSLLRKPVALLCHEVGDAVLNALSALGKSANTLDMLLAIEQVVREKFGLDVSIALHEAREVAINTALDGLRMSMIDVRSTTASADTETAARARRFEYPDLA